MTSVWGPAITNFALLRKLAYMRALLFCMVLLGLSLLSACDELDQSPVPDTTNDLIPAFGDTLSAAQLEQALLNTPSALQDTFFKRQLQACYIRMDTACLGRSIQVYEKLQPHNPAVQAIGLHVRGYMHTWASRYDSAEYYYNKALKLSETANYKWLSARILISRSGNISQMGNIEQDIRWKYQALEFANQSRDSSLIINAYMALANSLGRNRDYHKVKEIMQGLIPRVRNNVDLSFCHMIYAKALADTGQSEEALSFMRLGLQMRFDLNMPPSTIFEGRYHIGRILNSLGRYQEALDTLKIAEKQLGQVNNRQMAPVFFNTIAKTYEKLGDLTQASKYGKLALEISETSKDYNQAQQAAFTLYTTAKQTQNTTAALFYHELYKQNQDSLYKAEKEKEIQQLNVRYETREKEQKIRTLEREKELTRQRNAWIVTGVLLLALAGFYANRLHIKRRRAELEADRARSEAKAQQLAQQVELQQLELESHKKSLNDFTRMLIEKNEQIQCFYEQIKPEASPSADVIPLSSMRILTDQDWLQFQERFSRVYPGYIQQIRQQHPELSAADTRFLVLDKMGISLKETASILGIGLEAVKKGRYRLRKKLSSASGASASIAGGMV